MKNRPKSKSMKIFEPYRGRGARRRKQVKGIPHIFDYKTMLYVGASPARFELIDMFYDAGYAIDVLEIFKPNVDKLRKINKRWKIFRAVFWGDVRVLDRMFEKEHDVVVYWHGLEHIDEKDHDRIVDYCESYARRLVIFGMPWGDYPQPAVKGNEAERHVSALEPDYFEARGYTTSIVGKKRGRGSNLVAWKEMPE